MSRKFNFFVKQRGTVAILCNLCALFFMVSGCGKSNSSFEGCEKVLCTHDYKSIMLELQYPNGQPVFLDSSKVFWVSEKRYLNFKSWYVIVDDRMQKELQNKKEVMRFIGYMDDEIVCERDVLVGADCCHVIYYGTEPLTQIIQY